MKDSQNLKQKQTIKKEKKRKFKIKKHNPSHMSFPRRRESSIKETGSPIPTSPSFAGRGKSGMTKNVGILKKYKNDLLLLLVPIFLFVIFITLVLINNHFLQQIYANKITTFIPANKINPYPYVGEIPLLSLSAKAAIVVDADSQVIIFSKNPNLRFPMASTVKIMTALTAFDYYKNRDILTIKSIGIEGSTLNFQLGEQFYFEDLLYAMLLPSSNDAAVAIADNYPGGASAFIAKMNEKAKSLHLLDTHFIDSTGLEDTGDYTTVIDMAHLASAAIKNKQLVEITGTKQKTITNITGFKQYPLYNLNKLLGINGVTGIKTGTTEGAGEVLVTSVARGGHTFIIVVMNSTDRFADTQTLLNFIDDSVQFISPIQF